LTAVFHPAELDNPFWGGLPAVRTDTFGIACFGLAVASYFVGTFLRLRRGPQCAPRSRPPVPIAAGLALAGTMSAASTALVIYISLNAVTHPETLLRQATHLAAWPTEGLVRIVALGCLVASVAALRFLSAARDQPCPPFAREGASAWESHPT
jgi:hypothetical protein